MKVFDILTKRKTLRIMIFFDVIFGTLTNYTKIDMSFFFYIMCGTAILIFIRDIIDKRVNYKVFPNNLIVAILFIFLLTNLWNYRFSNIYSYIRLFEMFNYMIALSIVDNTEIKYEVNKIFNWILKIIFCYTAIMVSLSFILLFMQQKMGVNIPIILIFSNRFFSLFNNPNVLAVWAFISIFISCVFCIRYERYRSLLILNILIQSVAILLADCRTVYIMIVFSLLALFIFIVRKRLKFKFSSKHIIIIILISAALIGVTTQTSLGHVTNFDLTTIMDTIKRGDWNDFILLLNSFSSDRLHLWGGAFLCFLKSPILGIGVYNLSRAVPYYFDEQFYLYSQFHYEDPHGLIFSILSFTGLIGLLAFSTLFIRYFKKTYSYVMKNNNIENFLLCTLQFSMLIYAFFDIAVVFDGRIQAFIFWYFLGYFTFTINQSCPEKRSV